MSKEYEAYVKRCNELDVEPLSEFTPVRVNWSVIKWAFIVLAIMVNMFASVMTALMKTKR